MGTVPAERRGIAAGARTLLQNTGAVLSIAFVLAVVTSAVPKATLFAVFSGLTKGLSAQKLDPFIANMHVALWVLAATSLLGAFVCLMRPKHVSVEESTTLPVEEHATQGPPARKIVPGPAGAADVEPRKVGAGKVGPDEIPARTQVHA
jgi:hypothetical protein